MEDEYAIVDTDTQEIGAAPSPHPSSVPAAFSVNPPPHLVDASSTTAAPAQAHDPAAGDRSVDAVSSRRRGRLYLGVCLLFALALTVPNLGGGDSPAPTPCTEGARIAQIGVLPAPLNATPPLLALVRPPAYPGVAPGNEPGCVALYRSGDNGITWTVSFSATAEAPVQLATAPTGVAYMLTQRVQFPLYAAGNIYRSDAQGAAWTWARVSPQGRHDVPIVSASDLLVREDGALVLREANGDGAALIISRDSGVHWQPLVIPQLASAGSVAVLGRLLAVSAPLLSPGSSPGLVSADDGTTWRAMGPLPDAPKRSDLRPVLSAQAPVSALVLDLVPATSIGAAGVVSRYVSLDRGLHWYRSRCGAFPSPGCAPASRWAQSGDARFVLYRQQLFRSIAGGRWTPLPVPLPVQSDLVLQLFASGRGAAPALYLETATAIWRWDGGVWRVASAGLPLHEPEPVAS